MAFGLNAQIADIVGTSVPQYMASGSKTRMPVIAKALITGLLPNTEYQYLIRGYRASDISSTNLVKGAGNPLYIKENGKVKYFAGSVSFKNGATQDTFTTNGFGDYEGWFGLVNTGNSRFSNGNAVYLAVTAIAIGLPDTQILHISDSITALSFGSGSTNGTGIWGKSEGDALNFVSLYDELNPTGRPLSNGIIHDIKTTIASTVGFYENDVEGQAGRWAAIIPNNLSKGVRTISLFENGTNEAIYSSIDSNGVWGVSAIDTKSPSGGTNAIELGLDEAALVPPSIEFLSSSSSTSENKTSHTVYFQRKYSNDFDHSVRVRVAGNTATNGDDYTQINPQRIRFSPGNTALDSLTITLTDDNAVEGDEDIVFSLDSAELCVIGSKKAHIVTIADNDIAYLSLVDNVVLVDEADGKADVRIAIATGINPVSSVKLSVLSKASHTNIPLEFKVSSINKNDTTFTIGKSGSADTVTISTQVFEDIIGDLNDTIVLRIEQLSGVGILKDSTMTVVIRDNDGPSILGFVGSSATVQEDDDSFELKVAVIDRKGVLSDFAVAHLSDVSTSSQGLDFTYPTARIFSLDGNNPDTFVFKIALKDDEIYEGNETAVFGFSNLNKSAFNSNDTFVVNILENDREYFQLSKVNVQNAAEGVADSLGKRIRVSGTVYGINTRTSGMGFTFRDFSGGLGVYSPRNTYGYTVAEGDSILMEGRLSQFAGNAQLDFVDTVIVLKKNAMLKTATVVATVSEATENDLVKFNTVKLYDPSQWPSTAMATNKFANVIVEHTDGSYDTLNIDSETDIDGTPAPVGYFNVTGIASQLDFSKPYTTRYLLNPRRLSDFETSVLPKITFTKTADTISESQTSYGIILNVAPVTESFTAEVVIASTDALNPGDHTFSTQTVNVVNGTSNYNLSVPLADDNVSDGIKYITFAIRNIFGAGETGADSTLTLVIKDDEPTSVNTIAKAGIKLFPVPSTNTITVNSPLEMSGIQIYASSGQLVRSMKVENTSLQVDVSTFSNGLYHIQIELNNGLKYNGNFIKE